MTQYIQAPKPKGKDQWLVDNHGAARLNRPPTELVSSAEILICVVNNGPFEAAAVVDSPRDLHDFQDPLDPRPKVWLTAGRQAILDLLTSQKGAPP